MSTYEKHRIRDARIPFILHDYRFPHGVSDFHGNWHENVELLYFLEGQATVTSNDLHLEVAAGDLAVINANHIHTISAEGPIRYFVVIVDRAFCLSHYLDPSAVTFTPLVRDPEIGALLTALASEYAGGDGALSPPLTRARVLSVMALLLQRHSGGEGTPAGDTPLVTAVKHALAHIHAEYREDLTLDALSDTVGISKYYLAREFHRLTGMTVIRYLNALRCEKAKPLLAENVLSMEAVANAVGFSSASYFARVFRTAVGVSPSEYRRGVGK